MGSEEVPAGPLSGIRVLDFSMFMAGPYCTRLMADAGAEVIKIEPPDGDYLRGANPMRGPHSGFFAHMSCGKKSVKLDLKSAAGKAAIRRLMPTIDVVLENYRPGVMDRLELGYEALSALQPKLVFCSVSGYGQTGPDAKLPAYAPIIHAASGMDLALIEFERRLDRPIANRSTAADILAATHAFGAICAALVGRARTGKGERIDVALMDTMHHMLAYEVQAAQLENPPKPPVFEPIETRDGFIVVAPVSLLNFQSLARAIGRLEWLDDEGYATTQGRIRDWDHLMGEVAKWAAGRDADDCVALLTEAGCPCSRYRTVAESIHSPHVVERGSMIEMDQGAGSYLMPNSPFKFANADVRARPWVPTLGQHNDEVLGDLGQAAE